MYKIPDKIICALSLIYCSSSQGSTLLKFRI